MALPVELWVGSITALKIPVWVNVQDVDPIFAQSRLPTFDPLGFRIEIMHLPEEKLELLVVRVTL